MFVTARSSDLMHLHTREEQDELGDNQMSQIVHFQKFLEKRIMQLMSEMKFEQCENLKMILQKLNAIDILQLFLRKCVQHI